MSFKAIFQILCGFLLAIGSLFENVDSFQLAVSSLPMIYSRKGRKCTKRHNIPLDGLIDMDVVFYSDSDNQCKKLGAVQEDGTLLPLSAWSNEPAFGKSIEFVVDEKDRVPGGLSMKAITILGIVPEESLSYGSRQVGGGKGPGNPHGEESELLYYVDQDLLQDVEVVVKPELEILW